MADTKISALASLAGSGVEIAADVLAIVDDSVTTTKKIVVSNLLGAAYTAAGDIAQASAAGVAARLAIGTARQVPTVNSGATALAYANPITLGTEQSSASGTEIDFGSIPAGVRRITIMFVAISTDSTSPLLIQIGDAGGFETSAYSGGAGNRSAEAINSAGFHATQSLAAAQTFSGTVTLYLEDSSDFTWVESGIVANNTSGLPHYSGGSKALSAELTQVRITTVSGTANFDAGVINISYE